jgi:alkylhydroperoxidase family enzyme
MSSKIPDPNAAARDTVLRTVLDGPGATDPSLRYAAAEGVGVPDDLKALVEKVHRHAYKVTDEEIAALQVKYSDDQLFEIIVSAAVGASRQRLMAGLKALEDA